MERYIIFVLNVRTGEEFVGTYRALPSQHKQVMDFARRKYPSPDYRVHTTYTEQELQNVLSSVERWCGKPSDKVLPFHQATGS